MKTTSRALEKMEDVAISVELVEPPQNNTSQKTPYMNVSGDDAAVFMKDLVRSRMGWSEKELASLNDPSHPVLKDMPLIVAQLRSIRELGTKIVVLPDFDMDGIASGVLGYAGLSELGFNVELYIPDYRYGHDITAETITDLKQKHPDVQAVITCDCGVNSHEGIWAAKNLGLIVLVTDHHVQLPTEADGGVVCGADVLINPQRIDETYPHPDICGAVVFYQVLETYTNQYEPAKQPRIGLLKLFAGLGTVSDVMPLLYENRAMVRDSLAVARMLCPLIPANSWEEYPTSEAIVYQILHSADYHPVFRAAFVGFALMLKAWWQNGSLKNVEDLTAEFYGFYLAPAFNALRRIEAPMGHAFEVFTNRDETVAFAAAQRIISYNNKRKQATAYWLGELEARKQPLAPHVWVSDAPVGMLGLLAGKIMNDLHVPVVVVKPDPDPVTGEATYSGSARSPGWFPIISTLTGNNFADLGVNAVGHEHACGVRAETGEGLKLLTELFTQATVHAQTEAAKQQHGVLEYALAFAVGPVKPSDDTENSILYQLLPITAPDAGYSFDLVIPDGEVLLDFASWVDSFAPFGKGFAKPVIRLVVNLASCRIEPLGKDGAHLKLFTPSEVQVIWWNAGEHVQMLRDVAAASSPERNITMFDVDLSINRFAGRQTPQFVVKQAVLPEL